MLISCIISKTKYIYEGSDTFYYDDDEYKYNEVNDDNDDHDEDNDNDDESDIKSV